MKRIALALALSLGLVGPAVGQDTQPASRPLTQSEMVQKYVQLQQQTAKAFLDKEYEKAADLCRTTIELAPKRPDGYYNLACAMARLGKLQEALDNVTKSIERGYDEYDHMEADDDLKALRDDEKLSEAFKALMAKGKADIEKTVLKYEEMPGVKTVVRQPKGGLWYRLRMSPDATKDKPNKLIIWLHPSGGLANTLVEPMSQMFLKHGYALAVFIKKNAGGWSTDDANMLMNKTLPDMAAIDGLDASKPILMGFSAGGQMALMLYCDSPGKFGGLIVDAAYPVIPTPQGYEAMKLPDKPEIADVPILAVVGLADGGSKVWQKVEPKWLEKKVPLTVIYVPGAPHAWLLSERFPSERKVLDKWLEAVAAGKKPASQPASLPASQPSTKRTAPVSPLVIAR